MIGGGGWSEDRLVPDLVRSVIAREPLVIRSPRATRPWQHVLDCLGGYLLPGQRLLATPLVPMFGTSAPMGKETVRLSRCSETLLARGHSFAGNWHPVPSRTRRACCNSTAPRRRCISGGARLEP